MVPVVLTHSHFLLGILETCNNDPSADVLLRNAPCPIAVENTPPTTLSSGRFRALETVLCLLVQLLARLLGMSVPPSEFLPPSSPKEHAHKKNKTEIVKRPRPHRTGLSLSKKKKKPPARTEHGGLNQNRSVAKWTQNHASRIRQPEIPRRFPAKTTPLLTFNPRIGFDCTRLMSDPGPLELNSRLPFGFFGPPDLRA